MTGLYLGQAVGGFGASVAAWFSWHAAFHSFGIIGIIYALVLIAFLREMDRSRDGASVTMNAPLFKRLAGLFGNGSFWIILFYFAVASLPGWATKNWLPTLFARNLHIPMSQAGPLSTIAIAGASFCGVILGGILSDKWVRKNVRGRIYCNTIGLALTIPSLLLLGFGHTLFHVVTASVCFGFGFGIFDANTMPVLCQFVSTRHRGTAYGLLNMTGVFSGAIVTDLLGKSSDAGHLGDDFALLAGIVLVAVLIQLYFLRPKVNDYEYRN
jgi:sugar phosphate permease